MQIQNLRTPIAAGYVLLVSLLAVMSGVTSAAGWLALAVLIVGPPVALFVFWKDPSRSMSENIQAARR